MEGQPVVRSRLWVRLRQLCCRRRRASTLLESNSLSCSGAAAPSSHLAKVVVVPLEDPSTPQICIDDSASTVANESTTVSPACSSEPPEDVPEEAVKIVRRWVPGSQIERLLDDISDIWLGAEVLAVHAGDCYDIIYEDGSKERLVEGCELRPRTLRLEMPLEVWETVGSCLHEKQDLCTFETLARTASDAAGRQASMWWCTAYHQRFGRCGPRCGFERVAGAEGVHQASRAVAACAEAARAGASPADKVPWKSRYISQERLSDPRLMPDYVTTLAPGDVFYGASGKKASYNSPLKGMFFDPRLGRMVREF